jgi:putative glycosyltransferase (TIGR04348 family)
VTALRWARLLRGLGHRVAVLQEYDDRPCAVMIALHARRSFPSVQRFRQRHPDRPLVVALTGTDLYGDIRTDPSARQSMEWASSLILLQPMGLAELPEHLRARARVIYQSVRRPPGEFPPRPDVFEVCVLGHLREVKDPFRAALASRLLPAPSRVRIVHAGAALSEEMRDLARREMQANPRYRWLGELPRWKALRVLARCRLLVLSSVMEGGANAISEAIASAVPVLASRIPGSIGLLGEAYPGYFPVGDTEALANLLARAESDPHYLQALAEWCARLAPLVDPDGERRAWESVLQEVLAAA